MKYFVYFHLADMFQAGWKLNWNELKGHSARGLLWPLSFIRDSRCEQDLLDALTPRLIYSTSTVEEPSWFSHSFIKHFPRFKQTNRTEKFIYEILQEISHVSNFSFTSGKKERKGTKTRHSGWKTHRKFSVKSRKLMRTFYLLSFLATAKKQLLKVTKFIFLCESIFLCCSNIHNFWTTNYQSLFWGGNRKVLVQGDALKELFIITKR